MMKVRFYTLGCKVNQYESQAMLEEMERAGFTSAKEGESADVVVVNSCTVTAESDRKMRSALRRLKRENPGAAAVLTGCFPQAFPDRAEEIEEADIILGTSNRKALAGAVLEYLQNPVRRVLISPHGKDEKFEPLSISEFSGRTRAFLKIEDGCDRFCSYCVIPYARGRVRSRPPEDIRKEGETLAGAGYKEVVLSGINLPCYGQDLGLDLCDAIDAIASCGGICRVRLSSLEPEALTAEVITRLSEQKKLMPQFHLSLQSGCDETLKRMNRRYTAAEFEQICEDLREVFPGCALTTDVMVGFSGETEEEFAESLEFVRRIGFAKIHVFPYSRRPGTAAYNAPGQIPRAVKEERARRMAKAGAESRKEFMLSQVGRTENVLFEGKVCDRIYSGYTENYTPVRAESACPVCGDILPVRITEAGEDFVRGEIITKK